MGDERKPKPASGKPKHAGGRPRKLVDASRRKIVIEVLQHGGSRADAAQAACVDRTTLTDEVRRDPEFAQLLIEAEVAGKVLALKTIHGIMQSKDEHVAFKAASWFLGVKHWREWAKRNPDAIKPEEVATLIQQLVEGILNDVPPKYHLKIQARVNSTLSAVKVRK